MTQQLYTWEYKGKQGETCEHGARSKVTGTKQETGNPWMRWDCSAGFKACGVVWYHIDKTTGEWVK